MGGGAPAGLDDYECDQIIESAQWQTVLEDGSPVLRTRTERYVPRKKSGEAE